MLEDAGVIGKILKVNRKGSVKRRRAATKVLKTKPGFDRDEAPPSVLREDGDEVVVRLVPSTDNRSAGAQIGNQLGDAEEVVIQIVE